MHFNFIDTNQEVTQAWQRVFADVDNVTIQHGSIFDAPCDAIVSPANSFGFMNGGIDFSISKHLGWHLEKELQQIIREQFFGELLVGQAAILPTGSTLFPYLISAPTMRTPMTITRGPNVYQCMKALLLLLEHGTLPSGEPVKSVVRSVAVPGLGTGVGQVRPLVCARQMRLAWEDVMQRKYATKAGWEQLRSNYAYFYTHNEQDITYDIP
ncbi:macro domain-containing protein [Hymenobacter chitinivorans]|uniref:O-acetyl-ADP-ribose deacetylase (Regulator of RNase III) n=1 Tax=Hymenobacter chitinivorans DSM 11115 TaxID=1121954 RepID=A0A2M9BM52_9BACT|nr:macro domain-containing protein [Hymenobacter chitinivorans]PJJ59037.1 O-acetyl-ADP-ribose deacetylase (regulator of RNase III) [Hymenobacter chitinivorans DSM 11115]